MINILALSGLINFLSCVGLAYIVLRNRHDVTAKAYAIFNFTVAFFSFFYFIWQLSHSAREAFLWFQCLFLGIVWINQAYLYFVFTFLETTHLKRERAILFGCGCLNALFSLMDATGLLFKSVEPRYGLGFWPNPSHWFTAYLIFWHFECLYGFWSLFQGFRKKNISSRQRSQLKYLIVGCGIGYFGGASNWPMWYGIHFPPYLNNLIAVYIGIIAYAVLNRQFMDIRLILRDTTLHLITASLLAASCILIGLPLVPINAFMALVGSVCVMGFLMAFAYDPIRKALQPTIDRLVFANRFGYLEELSQLPNDLLEFTHLKEMLQFLVHRLMSAAKLESIKILMYDPAHQSYLEVELDSDEKKSSLSDAKTALLPHQISENSRLADFLKHERELWTQQDFSRSSLPDAPRAVSELSALNGAACFPVKRGDDLLGIVVLGRKRSGESFNQQDLKILRALQIRLENFLAQAMTITREALNMVKDSHDMKNDVNVLKGLITWRAMKLGAWKMEFDRQVKALDQSSAHADVHVASTALQSQADDWLKEASRTRFIEEDAIRRLTQRLRNWAEYGRLVSEGFRGSRQQEAVDVAASVAHAVERWRSVAEQKKVGLSAKVEGAPWVWGERSLLEQIVENLIDNALKATARGAVRVEATMNGARVLIRVKDSGCGIATEDLGSIFEKPFYQGRGRERLEQSTGIGLYLVAQYAKSLGGHVNAESALGRGSTFIVDLPVHHPEPSVPEAKRSPAAA